MQRTQRLLLLLTSIMFGCLVGCTALPGGTVVKSATVVYTAGSRQYTAAVKVPVLAPDVFAALIRVVTDDPEVEVISRKDDALLLEVAKVDKELTGQVTNLGEDGSLLYLWADAGASGLTGQELALTVVDLVCDELGVEYELVSY